MRRFSTLNLLNKEMRLWRLVGLLLLRLLRWREEKAVAWLEVPTLEQIIAHHDAVLVLSAREVLDGGAFLQIQHAIIMRNILLTSK